MVELRGGEQLLLGEVFVGGGRIQLRFQLAVQGFFQRRGLGISKIHHQRAPSFPVKLMRGSTSAIIKSPNKSPSTDTAA